MAKKPMAPRDLKHEGLDAPEDVKAPVTRGPDGQLHDADGLLVDEYSNPGIRHEPASDALDDPASLVNEKVLDNVADGESGIEEIDTVAAGSEVDLLDGGGRKVGGPTHRSER
jgi:hypothetical protein